MSSTTTKEFCTFQVGEMFFGVDVQSVQEVIRYQEMTKVPLALKEVGGLINLRGQIVTAIDMRQRLGLKPREAGKLPMNVVVHTEDSSVSLLVDEIGDVLDLEPGMYEPVPEILVGVVRELITGVYKLNGRLLLVLDTNRAVSVAAGERHLEQTTRIAV